MRLGADLYFKPIDVKLINRRLLRAENVSIVKQHTRKFLAVLYQHSLLCRKIRIFYWLFELDEQLCHSVLRVVYR